jgi:hypothetical protein
MENDDNYKYVHKEILKSKSLIHETITKHSLEAQKMALFNNSQEIDGIL